MEKIIIREKILPLGFIDSKFVEIFCGKKIYSKNDLLKHYDKDKITEIFFNENISDINDKLYVFYNLALTTGNDNELFKCAYKIDDEFAVHITQNIILYHIATNENDVCSNIVPWYYIDSIKYIGDSWWEEDDSIIKNIKNLSIIEFLKLYKGY